MVKRGGSGEETQRRQRDLRSQRGNCYLDIKEVEANGSHGLVWGDPWWPVGGWSGHGLGAQNQSWVQVVVPLLPACVTLNRLASLVSMPRSVQCGCYKD